MEVKLSITRENVLKSLERVKSERLFLPIICFGSVYMIDEDELVSYKYSQNQKKYLYCIVYALNNLLIDSKDVDFDQINNNSTNSKYPL